jgi:chromosome segregation ATPase
MSSQPHFNDHYKSLLDQLPPSMKKDVWLRLINRKNKPLSEEQVRGIHPNIEELLTREVNRYYNKKNRQKIKIEANVIPEGSVTLSRLDGFEKQLEERELRIQQRENNIKKTIEDQVAKERKCLKDEYDALMARKESEYNNCMVDMKQKIYSFKHQLEDQNNSRSDDLERQYKSRIVTLDKSIIVKDREIGKLSSAISQAKKNKNDLKKDLASAKKIIKELDDIIYSKDQTIIAYNERIRSTNPGCIDNTIEPSSFYEKDAKVLWNRWHDDAKDNPNIRKKYSFRSYVYSSIPIRC